MIPVFGYASWDRQQGQVRQCYERPEKEYDISVYEKIFTLKELELHQNNLSAFPILNLVIGIFDIYYAINGTNQPYLGYSVHEEDFEVYRKYKVIKGIAELTLVGGWLLHGGATLYYYATRPEPQYDPV